LLRVPTAVENIVLYVFRANVCLPTVAEVHTVQSSIKRLRVTYNAYRILHYIPRNVSVRPRQDTFLLRHFISAPVQCRIKVARGPKFRKHLNTSGADTGGDASPASPHQT